MFRSPFQAHIHKAALQHDSKIVLALDLVNSNPEVLYRQSYNMIQTLAPHLCAIKMNRHLVLPLGLYPQVTKLIDAAHELELPVIMDCKVNDIGNTNRVIAQQYLRAGFDALTANPFIGWDEGLEPIFSIARELARGVILVVYMSHKGSTEGYCQRIVEEGSKCQRFQYQIFSEKAREWGADGVVVGATYPSKIVEVNQILQGKIPIFTPGIGTQGGQIPAAAQAGATYFIIGRSILFAQNPVRQVKEFQLKINKYME